jgi:hypothetical protein
MRTTRTLRASLYSVPSDFGVREDMLLSILQIQVTPGQSNRNGTGWTQLQAQPARHEPRIFACALAAVRRGLRINFEDYYER